MNHSLIEALKPAAPARVHLLLAAVMWSVVGGGLLTAGTTWVLHVQMSITPWLIAVAVVAGWLKSRLVLDGAGRRIVRRIEMRGDGRCIGGFLSLRTWALVVLMVVGGRLLRSGVVGRHVVGLLYILVGTALILASRIPWRAWLVARASHSAPTVSRDRG